MSFNASYYSQTQCWEHIQATHKSQSANIAHEAEGQYIVPESRGWTPHGHSSSAELAILTSVARRKECFLAAFRLIYDVYLHNGLVRPNRLGLRILPHQLLERSWIVVVTRGPLITGTLSIVEGGALGLPIESLYSAEIGQLCRQGKRIAELTCFATTLGMGTGQIPVLRQLLRSAIRLATWRKIDYLTMCVHPRHAGFYERQLRFTELGPLRHCPWVRNQPAIGMCRRLGLPCHRAIPVDKATSGQLSDSMDVDPRPASRTCREYFWPLLDEASPMPWCGMRSLAA